MRAHPPTEPIYKVSFLRFKTAIPKDHLDTAKQMLREAVEEAAIDDDGEREPDEESAAGGSGQGAEVDAVPMDEAEEEEEDEDL